MNLSASAKGTEKVVLAGGCFWGSKPFSTASRACISAVSGYSGGPRRTSRYEKVTTGLTGHAESVQVVFDPSKITYGQLLRIFFSVAHDPTQLNRQGPDVGTSYRSAIFYANDEQKRLATAISSSSIGATSSRVPSSPRWCRSKASIAPRTITRTTSSRTRASPTSSTTISRSFQI